MVDPYKKSGLRDTLESLVVTVILAVFGTTFVVQAFKIPTGSMEDTLLIGDHLLVNKFAFAAHSPALDRLLPYRQVHRDDVVVFKYPYDDQTQEPGEYFVKRVIAEEGDQVRVVDGRVYRNDVPLDDSFVPPEYRSHDDWGPQVIPEGYYFVMGDHRNNSSDSRHWGFVPKKYIIGKVQLRWWPLGHARVF